MSKDLKVLDMKRGETLTVSERMPFIQEIRDMLEAGVSSAGAIADALGISRNTAIEWRKAALVLMEKDNNGWTRDSLRSLQIGRVNYWIEQTTIRVRKLEGKEDTKLFAQLMERLTSLSSELARISGLNIETHMNMNTTRHIVIKRTERVHTTEADVVE